MTDLERIGRKLAPESPKYPMTDAELDAYLAALPKPGPLLDAWYRVSWPFRSFWWMLWADYACLYWPPESHRPWRRVKNLRAFLSCARAAARHAFWRP